MKEENLISEKSTFCDTFCRIYSTGEVYMSRKLETTFRCEMDLHDYPFDTQECTLNIGSFAYSSETLEFDFEETPVEFYRDLELTSFKLLDVDTKSSKETLTTGTFPAVRIGFKFRRYLSFYVLQVGSLVLHKRTGTNLNI